MRRISDRAILTVLRHAGSWLVEHDGEHFGHSPDKEVAKASANKRARQMRDSGRACQVQRGSLLSGEDVVSPAVRRKERKGREGVPLLQPRELDSC